MPHPLRLPERSQFLFLLTRRTTRSSSTAIRYALQKRVQVRAPTFACKVSIVGWSSEGDSFGGTGEHVRDRVGESLEQVRLESDLIVDDVVMGGTDCALKTVVSLKEEIEICADRPSISRQSRPRSRAYSPYTAVIPLSTTVPGLGFPF